MQFTVATILALAAMTYAQTECKLPTSAVAGDGFGVSPANIDGVCLAASACRQDGGLVQGAGSCTGGAQCCFKNDCAGPNSNSACLNPSLTGDTLPTGEKGRFVAGSCPPGLRCFQLTTPVTRRRSMKA